MGLRHGQCLDVQYGEGRPNHARATSAGAELSSATGVPTPFVLEFGQLYADCARAEREIHGALDRRGLRVNANREFFHGPARDIVRIIMAHAGHEPPLGSCGAALAPAAPSRDAIARPGRDATAHERLALHREMAGRVRHGDRYGYVEIAGLHAAAGDAGRCFRAWELFFAAGASPGPGSASGECPDLGEARVARACRGYIACCLMLGTTPGHRALLLRAADTMLDQQLADLRRCRGTPAAPRIFAVMRWIHENLSGSDELAAMGRKSGQRQGRGGGAGRPTQDGFGRDDSAAA